MKVVLVWNSVMQQGTRPNWQVGTVFDIPLFIDSSWLVIVALITFVDGLEWQTEYPMWGTGLAWAAGFAMALLLFGSVLCHELGHSLIAQSQGTKVNSITLFIFGGLASIDEEAKTPEKAFQVAIAGPLVSLLLFVLLSLTARLFAADHPIGVLTGSLARINLVLALFNLIPGLPLDGGQILKAAVWKATGNRFKGVRWAAKAGQTLGWVAVTLGLITILLFGSFGGIWIALLGWFGLRNAYSYNRFADLQEALLELKAQDAMTRDFRVVKVTKTLREFADDYVLSLNRASTYFAASDGRYRGLIDADQLNITERSLWDDLQVQDLVQPLQEIPSVKETTSMVEVIDQLDAEVLQRVTVLSPAGAVAGVIDRGDVVRALAKKMNLMIADADIQRIKDEGSYPPNLKLDAIARSILSDATPPQSTETTP
ncbi:Putative zinc metalloprotease Rip3 [Acaryochloris thomasi RCC1774]|uniref:Zinc metalloprotease n=1 Tax=Acaryochloris thomasi RCC1774 TaxID=1764569 RepID=A0A2W1JYN6_9CYAN|nr:site-2 protease family protein [Acaryochloris thomasi]PZD75092.1 Putative zinc metalloprotease Rip3 [Acaryochloris thomasi RCC1774]